MGNDHELDGVITSSDLASAGRPQLERYGCVFHLEQRNRLAEETIIRYTTKHAYLDAGLGGAGQVLKLFVPGAGLGTTVASILAARPVIYQPMAQELSAIYSASPDQVSTASDFANRATIIQAIGDTGIELGGDLLTDIGGDLLHEVGAVSALSCVPIIGAAVSTVLDFVLARSLTWRLGTMISMYYQNGQSWIGDCAKTYARAKATTGGIAFPWDAVDDLIAGRGLMDTVTRYTQRPQADLNQVSENNKDIHAGQVQAVVQMIEMMMDFTKDRMSILQQLTRKGISMKLAQEALRWAFATGAATAR